MHDTDAFLQGIYAYDLNAEFGNVKSTESVNSAQAATTTLHKRWLDIESVDVSAQKGLSNLFSSKEKQEKEKLLKSRGAFLTYYKQGEPRNSDHQAGLIQICQI